MATNAPQTLSVKRKRNDPPVDSLIVERSDKRLKSDAYAAPLKRKLESDPAEQLDEAQDRLPTDESSEKRVKGHTQNGTVIWRRVQVPRASDTQPLASPAPETPNRRFHVSHTNGTSVLVERTDGLLNKDKEQQSNPPALGIKKDVTPAPKSSSSAPRKRPGAGTALKPKEAPKASKPHVGPSDETIRQFEQFSAQVENEEAAKVTKAPRRRSTLKFQPIAPKLRYKDRHPEKFKELDSMDMDTDEFVYDTYVREVVMPDANGNIPEPKGSVGVIVLEEEQVEWWFGDEVSDKEFDTDDEDENAEDYYANDYPEDEMNSEDEFNRGAYNYFHGESDEEYDFDEEVGNDDDSHARPTVPYFRQGYWGLAGEQE